MENSIPGSVLERAIKCRNELAARGTLKSDEQYVIEFRMYTEQIMFYREDGGLIESFNF
jgi:hypothetical protein